MESTPIAWKGHGQPPYGYDYNKKEKKLVINKLQAKHLKELFSFALKEEFPTLDKAVRHLNSKGIKSSRGKLWSYKTVRYLFEDAKLLFYAGHKDGHPGEWEPIIDIKMAEALNKKKVFSYEKSRPRTRVYLLTDLDILKCGYCGSSVKAARSVNPNSENLYYRCAEKTYRSKNACGSKLWRMKEIDNIVFNDIEVHIPGVDKIKSLTKQFETKRNKEAGQSINQVTDDIGRIIQLQNLSTNKKEIEQLNEQLTEKLQEKNQLLTLKQESFDISLLKQARKIGSLPVSEQKVLLHSLIKKITLHRDKIIIDYRFCFAPNKYSQTLKIN